MKFQVGDLVLMVDKTRHNDTRGKYLWWHLRVGIVSEVQFNSLVPYTIICDGKTVFLTEDYMKEVK